MNCVACMLDSQDLSYLRIDNCLGHTDSYMCSHDAEVLHEVCSM